MIPRYFCYHGSKVVISFFQKMDKSVDRREIKSELNYRLSIFNLLEQYFDKWTKYLQYKELRTNYACKTKKWSFAFLRRVQREDLLTYNRPWEFLRWKNGLTFKRVINVHCGKIYFTTSYTSYHQRWPLKIAWFR